VQCALSSDEIIKMQKTGGIIGLIAGIFGVPAAAITLVIGGMASAFQADGASTVVGLGGGGILFSFLCIIFGAVAMGSESRIPGALLTLCAIAGAILGGTLVAVCMALAFVGGVLATMGAKKRSLVTG
jgi:hypothetical protein